MRGAVCLLLLISLLAVSCQEWLAWSEWNGSCKVNSQATAQTRFRVCKPPKSGAAPCFGDATEVLACGDCPASGTWGEWSVMDGCSDNCGAFGRRFRTRECKKPLGCPNAPCLGEARELEEDGAPCDHQSPCLVPKKSCHPDYKQAVSEDQLRLVCVKK